MMEEMAKVVACDDTGWIRVEVEIKSACNHCDNNDSCGTSAVSKAFSVKAQQFSILSDKAYPIGEWLKIGLPESVILKAAALVYLFPLMGFFLGAFLANSFFMSSDMSAFMLGVTGGVLAWALARKKAALMEKSAQPVILAYIGQRINQLV
ncbi:SoxR reducing system RseC family protein [Shewanella surugensis]|uniref:SoxR reducing system RseC family protein n=1 Tax=Shewanella surugensis TaxID=212020 RepID=A0ABT0L6J1_9GAMM|nr:SoxR reducing system RseC family protein [Shewanella surugensis]MCL1123105.1 SoxR reducing system RseC family protein [Shewanella surugensis]